MLERLTHGWRNVLLAVLLALVLWFCWTVRSVLNPLIAAYFLAYVVHPMVVKLERRGFSRRAAVNWIFCIASLGTVLVGVGVYLQSARLVKELTAEDGITERIADRIDEQLAKHQPALEGLFENLFGERVGPGADEASAPDEDAAGAADASTASPPADESPDASPEESPAAARPDADAAGEASTSDEEVAAEPDEAGGAFDLRTLLRRAADEIDRESAVRAGRAGLSAAGSAWNVLSRVFGSVLALLTFLFLLPIYTWFLLFELGNIHRFVVRYTPVGERARMRRIGRQIGEVLANFFRGRLLVALAKGTLLTIGLRLAGVDYSLLIGLGSGVLSLIPFAGALAGGIFAFLVALLDHGFVGALLRVLAIYMTAEVIEGYVLVPKILGDSLGLPPVVVLFAVFVGGAALGVFGLLLALPLTASILILVRELVLPALAEFADERDDGGEDPPDEVFAGVASDAGRGA